MLGSQSRSNYNYGLFRSAGPPLNGIGEVQTLTQTGAPTGGTFSLRLGTSGTRTVPIAYNASAATIVTAIEALETVGAGNVVATGGPLNTTPVVVTFGAGQGAKVQPLLVLAANDLTGGAAPSIGIARTVAGVTATARGAGSGALLVDTVNRVLYENAGSPDEPNWLLRGGRRSVNDHIANHTLDERESGSVHTNAGAAGTVTIALPPCVAGLEFTFGVAVAQQLRIDPDSIETISLPSTGVPSAPGKYLVASAVGATLHLVCLFGTNWAVQGYSGTWTAEA